MNFVKFNIKNIIFGLLLTVVLIYVIFKAYSMGNDINIYLKASHKILNHKNLYPDYIYSPLFALILSPLSFLNSHIARIIWAIINFVVVLRLLHLLNRVIYKDLLFKEAIKTKIFLAVIFVSAGFLNHNLILGQITIIILWLTAEGLYQIFNNKEIKGSALIALGINIKILPLLILFYLVFKKKYKSVLLILIFVFVSLFLPALFVGFNYNNNLLINWANRINPSGEKYILENNNESNSADAILSAYLYKYHSSDDTQLYHFKRKITSVSGNTLIAVIQIVKLLLILSVLLLIFYKYKRRRSASLYLYWEFAWLMLISLLIFPHQMAYALLYLVPAEIYMLIFIFSVLQQKKKMSIKYKLISFSASVLMFVSAVSGRDVIGSKIVDIFNFYHMQGIVIISFLLFLLLIKPDDVLKFHPRKTE